jgi:hypothetical protein
MHARTHTHTHTHTHTNTPWWVLLRFCKTTYIQQHAIQCEHVVQEVHKVKWNLWKCLNGWSSNIINTNGFLCTICLEYKFYMIYHKEACTHKHTHTHTHTQRKKCTNMKSTHRSIWIHIYVWKYAQMHTQTFIHIHSNNNTKLKSAYL